MKATWIRFLAACELLGGIFTIAGYAILVALGPQTLAGWQIALGVSFGALAGYAGVQLMRGHVAGLYASLVVQVLQVGALTIVPVMRFVALAGIRFGPVVSSRGLELQLRAGGDFIAIPFARDTTLAAVGSGLEVGTRLALESLTSANVAFSINFLALYFVWKLVQLHAAERSRTAESLLPAI